MYSRKCEKKASDFTCKKHFSIGQPLRIVEGLRHVDIFDFVTRGGWGVVKSTASTLLIDWLIWELADILTLFNVIYLLRVYVSCLT